MFKINPLCYALIALAVVYSGVHTYLGFPTYSAPEVVVSLVFEILLCVFVIRRHNWARVLMIVFGAASAPFLFYGVSHEPHLIAAVLFVANVLAHVVLAFQLILKKNIEEFLRRPAKRWGRWFLLCVALAGVAAVVMMVVLEQ